MTYLWVGNVSYWVSIDRACIINKGQKIENTTYQALQEDLMKQIDKIHTQFPYMGSRKIVIKLKENGYNICRKTVRRLMQKMGIYAIYPKPNLSK